MTAEVDRLARASAGPHGAALAAMLGDWSSGRGPLYALLADAVRAAVDDGRMPAGARLPAERTLARDLAVSRATVVAAYDTLRAQGLVESRQGSGTRVSATARARRVPGSDGRVPGGTGGAIVERLIAAPSDVLSLTCSTGEPTELLPEALAEVTELDLPAMLDRSGYSPRGLPRLREAVADRYTRAGLPTHPDEVLVTTGAQQAVSLAAELWLRPGATAVVETPGPPSCLDILRARGARLVTVPVDDDGIVPDALARALAAQATDLVYVMPTYHNPTGALLTASRRHRVAELAMRHDVPLIADDALEGTGLGAQAPPPLGAYVQGRGAPVVDVGSLSKSVWDGLRIGWLRGPVELVERLARRKALADLGSPVLDQLVAARLLPRLDAVLAQREAQLAGQLKLAERLVSARLPDWRWTRPTGGPSLWIELPGVDAAVLAQVALRHGVELVPGRSMDPTGAHDTWFRLPYSTSPERMAAIVDRLATAWADLHRHGPLGPRLVPIV